MIRISVSNLMTYQRYRDLEEVALEDCLADLRKERPPTPAMMAGSALHKVLEHASYGDEAVSAECDGFNFRFECDIDLDVPVVRELKGEIEMMTPSGPVTLVGVVDAIDASVYDYKLTGRAFDAERLSESFQWRCYLHMFNRDRFVYRVFVGTEKGNEWVIREYHELVTYRYDGMEAEIQREIDECAEFMSRYLVKKAA